MTVDPANGEVFYYDYKDRKIHQLHSCNGEGKFVEVEGGAFSVSPQRGVIEALVFNPVLQYEPSRAAGVLYAAAPGRILRPGVQVNRAERSRVHLCASGSARTGG